MLNFMVGFACITLTVAAFVLFIIMCVRAERAALEERRRRRERILAKYGETELAERIVSGAYWDGQTREELIDALGEPADIDTKVLKTKRREVWKYHHRGANRYGLRITVENGTVVGWDEKL